MKKFIYIFLLFIFFMPYSFYAQIMQDWVTRYNGPLTVNPEDVPVMVRTDNSGNIYVAGYTYNNLSNYDYYLIKYNSSGVKQWEKTYDNPWHLNDKAVDFAIDLSGNVYLTGISENNDGYQSDDFLTIKYNSAGDTLWTRRYNGAGDYIDEPVGIQISSNGYIYVGGESIGDPPNEYYCVIKYDSNGNQIWLFMNTTPPAKCDFATSLKLDNAGNLYITGYCDSMGASHYAFQTLKLNPAGNIIWKRKYHGPVFNDYAKKVEVDNHDNVYVIGASASEFNYINYDYATIKYDSSGNQLWVARYNGPANNRDIVNSIGFDQNNNVFVSGYSKDPVSNFDITTIKYNSSGVQQWINRFNGTGNDTDKAYMLKVDNNGNVFVTGFTETLNNYFDLITLKFNNSGSLLWNKTYNGSGDSTDVAFALTLDNSSNVIIAGESMGSREGFDIETIKYNSSGVPQWETRQSRPDYYPSDDYCTDMITDINNNIYVIGRCQSNFTSQDFLVIKYNSSGIQQWLSRVNGTGNGDDEAIAASYDSSGYLIVAGSSLGLNSGKDIMTIKYNLNGDTLWSRKYNGTANLDDIPAAIKVDRAGNIYITGTSKMPGSNLSGYITLKYSSSGSLLWSNFYSNNIYSDHASDLVFDNSGNVYVTGTSKEANNDIVTIKYNSSGVQQWLLRFNVAADEANKIIIDSLSNLYLAGQVYSSTGMYWYYYFLTIKIDKDGNHLWSQTYGGSYYQFMPTSIALDKNKNVITSGYAAANYTIIKYNMNGVQQWVANYNGTGNSDDRAYSMCLDSINNIYLTGGSIGTNTYYDFSTVKFDTTGNQVWAMRYNGPRDSSDIAKVIKFDKLNNIYVCGSSAGTGTNNDITLIKYRKTPIGIPNISSKIPLSFSLSQNYPNPFNPSTTIKFDIPKSSHVKIVIYDLLGRQIEELLPPLGGGQEGLKPGSYEISWDGSRYSSGVYFYKIITDDFVETKKMVLIK